MTTSKFKKPNALNPTLSIWFGNFFKSFYSNREAIAKGIVISEVRDLGFTTVIGSRLAPRSFCRLLRVTTPHPQTDSKAFHTLFEGKH